MQQSPFFALIFSVFMKRYIVITFFYLLISSESFCQIEKDSSMVRGRIIIKSLFLPFLFESGIDGRVGVTDTELVFKSDSCSSRYSLSWFAPCNGNIVPSIRINIANIKAVRRRNFLFLIPNRLYVICNDNTRFLFLINKRGKIRRKLLEKMQIIQKNRGSNT
jgi:ribosomal protein L36